ncbi:MAG: S-layer homology domain-containing protein [Eubacteriales bacterium]|nr:S-layer homology domain-containing protein [Eubacteriales bacterium]
MIIFSSKPARHVIFLITVLSIIFFSLFLPLNDSYAAIDPKLQEQCAQTLNRLQIMLGDNSGNLHLADNITRSEFVTLVIRIMGYDRDKDVSSIELSFEDKDQIKDWAVEYVKLALKYNLLKGYPGNLIKPNATVTNAEAQTILLRALGYEEGLQGNWPNNILEMSNQLGLDKGMLVEPGYSLTRGESAVVIYNSLSIYFK